MGGQRLLTRSRSSDFEKLIEESLKAPERMNSLYLDPVLLGPILLEGKP